MNTEIMILEEVQKKKWKLTPKIPLTKGSENITLPNGVIHLQVKEDSVKVLA
jgi:hypothetical protein